MIAVFNHRTVFLLSLIAAWTSTFAGPPYLTDDPEPVDLGHVEINTAFEQLRNAGGRTGAFATEINYGGFAETQLHLGLPVALDHEAGQPAQRGLGDVEAGVKYRFVDETEGRPMVAFYPTAVAPTGDAHLGLGNGAWQVLLPLWLQKSIGPWTFDTGAGRWINRAAGARDNWYTGALAQRTLSERLTVGGELYHRTPQVAGARATTGFNFGATYAFTEEHHLLFSMGRGLRGADDNWRSLYVAYQFAR